MNQTCDTSGKQLRQVLWRENLEVTWIYLYRWLKQVRSLLFVHREKKAMGSFVNWFTIVLYWGCRNHRILYTLAKLGVWNVAREHANNLPRTLHFQEFNRSWCPVYRPFRWSCQQALFHVWVSPYTPFLGTTARYSISSWNPCPFQTKYHVLVFWQKCFSSPFRERNGPVGAVGSLNRHAVFLSYWNDRILCKRCGW